ncbi:MAG TPA: serine hydrolase, partial [Limnochordia bacterium]
MQPSVLTRQRPFACRGWSNAALAMLVWVAAATHAFAVGAAPVEMRADAVAALISDNPEGLADHFSPALFDQLPAEQMAGILRSIFAQFGAVQRTERIDEEGSPFQGRFHLYFSDGTAVPMTLQVGTEAPHLIVGIFFHPPISGAASASDVLAEIDALPGESSVLAARLGDQGVSTLFARNADTPLAIGSAFKLYVLAALAHAINSGERHWSDTVELTQEGMSLPSGVLHTWPVGAPLTVHTLAALMISISDNTAADHLILSLGRQRVEEMLAPLGQAQPERNIPFLRTSELFRIKLAPDAALRERYARTGAAERRALLAGEIEEIALSDLDPGNWTAPIAIDTVEWFASAADLVRILDWLRRE